VNKCADTDAQGRDQPRVAALPDAATDDVQNGGAWNGEQQRGGADEDQKRSVVGKHRRLDGALRGGEQDRFALRDDDSMLVMRGKAAVGGANGPAIAIQGDAAGGGRDDGLDGDDKAFGEEMAGFGGGVVRDAGLLVNGATNAVAAEFADDLETAPTDFAFYGAADVFGAIAGAGGDEGLAKSALGAVSQFTGFFSRGRDLDGDGGVRVVAIFYGGEIELDEVAGLNGAWARDSVDDFVVDADADVAREIVDERWRGLRAVFGQDARADSGEFGGADADANGGGHGAEGFGDDQAAGAKFFELFCGGDGHGLASYD